MNYWYSNSYYGAAIAAGNIKNNQYWLKLKLNIISFQLNQCGLTVEYLKINEKLEDPEFNSHPCPLKKQ